MCAYHIALYRGAPLAGYSRADSRCRSTSNFARLRTVQKAVQVSDRAPAGAAYKAERNWTGRIPSAVAVIIPKANELRPDA
jgi:hypothetical protein